MIYTNNFPIEFAPLAHPDAVVIRPNVRFTVLTSRLLRLEFSPNNSFEDRPSQAFWYRRQPVPDFEMTDDDGRVTITTDHLQLAYHVNDAGFTAETLTITLKEHETSWHYGQEDPFNLLGTYRTLDQADGALALEQGLISRSGWAVYDDTPRLIFNEDGWLEARNAPAGTQDLYFFGYGQDYYTCLQEFTKVAGKVPLLPRYALGNWWSRYWNYSDKELLGLMDEFQANNVPLSVCIVDMDWHITDTGNKSSGWTGYTWNRALFPNPPAFIDELHQRGLKTALNLHPADGVHPHEAQYEDMAQRIGIDPETQQPLPFNIADPTFTQAYFELLHHPYEKDGIDFWWIDWQQGENSQMPGLDPLWWLNHLHFYDLARHDDKRSFTFSRWGGLGNHRYPIGFSGDTVVSWDSLAFQPYFTATAANVNYGWWSHDIGGHMGGIEEPELYTRWMQYGLFSPILRMHCTQNPFHERRPWGYDAETEKVASHAMRLRHAFIPYLYTMSWRNHVEGIPPIRPMYYDYPADEPAYHCPDQYTYGSELIAAPFISPINPDTRLSRQVVWLPEGVWFGFFDGLHYPGDGWQSIYGSLEEIPVFAKAGAVVPLTPEVGWGGVGNPDALEIHLFPGANNQFELYEDDDLESYSLTPISQIYSAHKWAVKIEPVQGNINHLPASRAYTLLFRGLRPQVSVEITVAGETVPVETTYEAETNTLQLTAVTLTATQSLIATISTESTSLISPADYRLAACHQMVRSFPMNTWLKSRLDAQLPGLLDNPADLTDYELALKPAQIRALAETLTGAGVHRGSSRHSADELTILWNNRNTNQVNFHFAAIDMNRQPIRRSNPLPKFLIFSEKEEVVYIHEGTQPAHRFTRADEWFDTLPDRFQPARLGDLEAVIQFDISGQHGRTCFITISKGKITFVSGIHNQPDLTLSAAANDWLALINGEKAAFNLFMDGKLQSDGNMKLLLRLSEIVKISARNDVSG